MYLSRPIYFGRDLAEAMALGFYAQVPMLFHQDSFAMVTAKLKEMARLLEIPFQVMPGHRFDLEEYFFPRFASHDLPKDGSGILIIKRLEQVRAKTLLNLREYFEEGAIINWRKPKGWVIFATVDGDDKYIRQSDRSLLARFCHLEIREDRWAWPDKPLKLDSNFACCRQVKGLNKPHPSVAEFRKWYTSPHRPGQYHDPAVLSFGWDYVSRLMRAAECLGEDSIAQEYSDTKQTALMACLESQLGNTKNVQNFLNSPQRKI